MLIPQSVTNKQISEVSSSPILTLRWHMSDPDLENIGDPLLVMFYPTTLVLLTHRGSLYRVQTLVMYEYELQHIIVKDAIRNTLILEPTDIDQLKNRDWLYTSDPELELLLKSSLDTGD